MPEPVNALWYLIGKLYLREYVVREFQLEIETNDGLMDVFICDPEEGGPHPVIIFYMDAPGIREELRGMARRLSSAGYYVFLPNMYYRVGREGNYGFDLGKIGSEDSQRKKMFEVMNSLNNSLVISDTAAILEYIRSHGVAGNAGIGCVGYCMSGQYVMSVAAAFPDDFMAIASFYGVGIITDKDDSPHLCAKDIRGEVYLAFASNDPFVPSGVLDSIPNVLDAAKVNYSIEVYPNTEHGFAFPERPVYAKEAAELHWKRLFELYARNLGN